MFRTRRRSEVPSLNTSSTADISFMLLVFFLVSSSMDSDKGMTRQLPPPPQQEEKPLELKQSDMLTLTLDAQDRLTADGDSLTINHLAETIERFAAVSPRQRVVVVETAPETSYNAYFQLQQAVVKAYRNLGVPPRVAESSATTQQKGGEP